MLYEFLYLTIMSTALFWIVSEFLTRTMFPVIEPELIPRDQLPPAIPTRLDRRRSVRWRP